MGAMGGIMETSIERHAPQVRCHKCGSLSVHALCHHCWRPGCVRHVRPTPHRAEKLLGQEGSGPGLANADAFHCAECGHVALGHRLALCAAGVAVTAVGIIVIWLNLIAGPALILAGGALAGWAYLDMRRQLAKVRASMPLMVHPKVDELRLVEKLRSRITLGPEGDYDTDPDPVEAELTAVLVFGRADRDRLTRYLHKRPRETSRDVPFLAGCLVFQGRVGVEVPDFPGPVLALEGSTGALPVFRAEDPHASSSWTVRRSYQLPADPDTSPGVIWITPSLLPGSDRRALELEIQWVEVGPDRPLILDVIDLLELRFPVSWGEVRQASEPAIHGILPPDSDGKVLRSVKWKHLLPTEEQGLARRLTLVVQFENQINDEDEHEEEQEKNVLHGRLEATMSGTLSGVDSVRMYGALGGRRYPPRASLKTRIEADFKLSLASIRYQDVWIAPGREAADGDDSSYVDEFGVIPNRATVIELTNAMSEHDYYLKRVIENPPRSGGRADRVQRFWDIAGRRYKGVYPIDFHVVLTGEEVHRGDIQPERGTTKVQIVVHGAYINEEMKNGIGEEWKALRVLTTGTLDKPGLSKGQPGPAGPAGAAPQDPPAGRRTDPPPYAPPDARLMRRLGKLDEALLDERISPEQYEEMRARAEQELGDS
jgi:hypothetical protein